MSDITILIIDGGVGGPNLDRERLTEQNDMFSNKREMAFFFKEYQKYRTVSTIAEARQYLAHTLPDIVLLDSFLPDGDSIEFCRELRRLSDFYILFLTIDIDAELEESAIRAGADNFVSKYEPSEKLILRVDGIARRIRANGKQRE